MLLMYPIRSEEIKKINIDLRVQEQLYQEAIANDSTLSIKKEIRLNIKALQAQIQHLKVVCLGLRDSRQ